MSISVALILSNSVDTTENEQRKERTNIQMSNGGKKNLYGRERQLLTKVVVTITDIIYS